VRIQRQAPDFLPHGVEPDQAAAYWNERHRDWLATLGTRSVIVDTDALRRDPEPWLERMAAGLGLDRLPGLRAARGLSASQGTEEVYELLGAPITREMEREFTTIEDVDPAACARFAALLDQGLLRQLGLRGDRKTA